MRVVTMCPNSLPNIGEGELLGEEIMRLGDVAVYCTGEGPYNCDRPTDGHPLHGTLTASKPGMTEAEAVAVRKEMLAWLFSE